MKIKMKDLLEIVDSNGELIGSNATPTNGNNLESQANNTTDYNQKIGTQPFRYDMLGRFGFTLMPFMESVNRTDDQQNLFDDLNSLLRNKNIEMIEYYYKNPNKLKSDYRKLKDKNNYEFEKNDNNLTEKIIKIFEKHFENAFQNVSAIDEAMVIEDRIVLNKIENEMSTKGSDNDIKNKKILNIVGLINKLDNNAIDKLINILERKQ